MIRAEILTHPLERKREAHLFERRIDRRRGLDRRLQASQAGIGVFAKPFRVRLGALVARSYELPGVAEELTVERGAPFEPRVRNQNLAVTRFGAGDVVPGAARCRLAVASAFTAWPSLRSAAACCSIMRSSSSDASCMRRTLIAFCTLPR